MKNKNRKKKKKTGSGREKAESTGSQKMCFAEEKTSALWLRLVNQTAPDAPMISGLVMKAYRIQERSAGGKRMKEQNQIGVLVNSAN